MGKGRVAMKDEPRPLRMLVIDTAYTHAMIKERHLAELVTCRDLDGYFDHVWSVHPFASLFLPNEDPDRFGKPVSYDLAPRHTLIEGKFGRFGALRWAAPLNFLLSQVTVLRGLSRLVREERIAILRAEDPWNNGLLAWLLSRRHRLPLVIGVWGNPGAIRAGSGRPILPRLMRWVWLERAVERFVLRRADLVIVQNEDNRAYVLSSGVPLGRTAIFRLGNMIHPVHFSDPADRPDATADLDELHVERGSKTVGCISRLVPEKLVEGVVRAVAKLNHDGIAATTILIGDGAERDKLAGLARQLGVGHRLIFAGNRDQKWIARVVPALDVLASPLTGRALVEAGLGAAPIVAYDMDWQGEVIRSGETGELVACGDWEAMALAIARLLDDSSYARRLGVRLRAELMEMMDPAANNRAQAEAYDRLLGVRV